jgi:hypothetical protein
MRIEVTRHDNPDPKKSLRREVWEFNQNTYAIGLGMRLCGYSVQTRPSIRHRNWTATDTWPRGHSHTSMARTLPQPESIPDDVVAEVKQQLMDAFTVEIGWAKS